ncbi:MAG: transmembrane 220 family protein [Daejeonella sp.]|uniref:transmembrane 220 family protein n=1 Tax=Daejeonella sp. TaxID=2805397 RepID=UPI0027328A29|nr:transmembrane 220 family protein [Daejeonella sp.]MDP3469636.1 transmembrane 220 family protein [Daejeonella sp.]
MKIFNFIFLTLFVISAGLQYNDPDPALWIIIYLFGAMICFFAIRKKNYPRLTLAGIILMLIYAVYLFFDKDGVLSWLTEHQAENIAGSMKASSPWIEETREFFGLVILILVLSINLWTSKRQENC